MESRPRRTFNPRMTRRYGRPTFPHDKLVKFSPKWGYARLFNFPFPGSHWRPRMHTIVIAVDGASKINDRFSKDTRGAFGVFVGHGSPRNSWDRLTGDSQTNSRAELEAVKQGLATVHRMFHVGDLGEFYFKELIIKTDSAYVHNTFNDWIWNYIANGYKRSNGKYAEHANLIAEIHAMICEMEGPMNMAVRFWRVPRELNKDADELANRAFQDDSIYSHTDSESD